MSCDELYERLTDRAEGTLDGEICAEVDRHLATCGECQQVRQDLQDLARLCRQSAEAAVMPEDVRRRIEALLTTGEPAPRPSA